MEPTLNAMPAPACENWRQAGLAHTEAGLYGRSHTLMPDSRAGRPKIPVPISRRFLMRRKLDLLPLVANTSIVFAARLAASRFGGNPGGRRRRAEATHDLGLAQAFLKLL